MKKSLLVFLALLAWVQVFATHQRAGEITYRVVPGKGILTYEITIVTYSYSPSPADRDFLTLDFGDGTQDTVFRINGPAGVNPAGTYCNHLGEIVAPDIKKNIYIKNHTYAGMGVFKISLTDPNRNYGILNIPNSVEVPLYIETMLTINPFIGAHSSPQLILPPIDNGCVNNVFRHNPGAYDPNGDSLSYKLVVCRTTGGVNIPGYKYPNQVDPNNPGTFTIDPKTGDITWDKPTLQGEYNFAFLIEEWRNGAMISYVTRDMQVTITNCTNKAPSIDPVPDHCVKAGNSISYKVSAHDPDNVNITLTASGAPFLLPNNPATFTQNIKGLKDVTGTFTWNTAYNQVQKRPYQIYYKVSDNLTTPLTDIKSNFITVIAPPPTNPSAVAIGRNIRVSWDKTVCPTASGYNIYRRTGHSGLVPDTCTQGVPDGSGYVLIGTVPDINTTSFTDDNKGKGLSHGLTYCYVITAIFPDGAESYPSAETCASLVKDLPIITNVSILTTSSPGKVSVAWSKPTQINANVAPGPYKYLIYRSNDLTGSSFALIDSTATINDTTYTDLKAPTAASPVSYRLELINLTPGNRFSIGFSETASSVRLIVNPGNKQLTLNMQFNVPWNNYKYVIYRRNPSTSQLDSIGVSTTPAYTDLNLVNGQNYCYVVKAIGTYGSSGLIDPLINLSQEACGSPSENVVPCPPTLALETLCSSHQNKLTWNNPNSTCLDKQINKYVLFYALQDNQPFTRIDSTLSANDTVILNAPKNGIAGCYAVVAVNSKGVESAKSNIVCADVNACPQYRLPNVFTPNGDEYNDKFRPFPGYSVLKVNMHIFNRWGEMVFETTDPEINWDGKSRTTKKDCASGVYFYTCEVYEQDSSGKAQKRILKGAIELLR
ncbi:MAG: gliding motility-associated C-terminal domain-containing protein [Bacteroidota bacterium]|nr:gliding motility-associated C-terminal domain-containing protein [Bacteroidota bacterium]